MDTRLLKPGLRLAVGVSGGADSVALLRALHERSGPLGLVLHAAHLHHGLRGAEADGDLEFVRALAAELGLPFHEARVDAGAEAGKAGETIEEAARRLRYAWFRQLMAAGAVEAVATAHTRDDQAETVCAKFLRGAWTEGLSGIHPVVEFARGPDSAPAAGDNAGRGGGCIWGRWARAGGRTRRIAIRRLRATGSGMNCCRCWRAGIRGCASIWRRWRTLARDEEAWWQVELARLAPQIVMSGTACAGRGPRRRGRTGFGRDQAGRARPGVAAEAVAACGRAVGRGAGFSRDRGAADAGAGRPGRTETGVGQGVAGGADTAGIAADGGVGFGGRGG